MATFIPEVSVIIPLYNAEKFIADCLESLLAQTLKNFEVIIVDDCSTDSSPAIVKSYAKKFGGRLTFSRLKKNSGNAGYSARNKGFAYSRGEYVFFIDADDFITETALEELYTLAKNFTADVVYTGSRYRYTTEGGTKFTTDRIGQVSKAQGLEDKPTLTINDPHKNLTELLLKKNLYHTPWTKFVRRDFLNDKGITFYETISGGDYIWTIELFATAERFLRVPNAVYFWRDDSFESMTRSKKSTAEQINKWGKILVSWCKAMSALSDKIELLRKNPVYSYEALSFWIDFSFKHCFEARMQVNPEQIFEILHREFADKGDIELTIPLLFSVIDLQQKQVIMQNRRFQQTAAHAQEQVNKFKQFAAAANKRIAQLEAELKRLKS